MKNKKFDRRDFLAAFGLFFGVAVWAFLWSYPYPHPGLWPFLVFVQGKVGMTVFGVAGRFALGVFAALVYLVLRGCWMEYRDRHDEKPDNFRYTRTTPICAAAFFTFLPYSWRSAQFLSSGFALLILTLIGAFLWFRGRAGRGYLSYSLAYLILGFVSGVNLLGFAPLGFIAVSDAILRWKDDQAHGQREDDEFARRKKLIETWFSVVSGVIGFVLGVCLLSAFVARGNVSHDFAMMAVSWCVSWTGAALRSVFSLESLAMLLSIAIVVMGLAAGRRIRSLGSQGRMLCRVSSWVLMLAAVAMLLRAVDRPERIRLQAIREYVSIVADDARGAKFLFTDGRFDDALRLEFASRGEKVVILNTVVAPSPREAMRLKSLAPVPADRAIFEAGGAEVFKAWARERPDRLAESAWQLGGAIVRRYGKSNCRTCGSVVRCEAEAKAANADAADRRFIAWSQRIAGIAEACPPGASPLGGADDVVAERFDALLWRAARLAEERAVRWSAAQNAVGSKAERHFMLRLDELNATLRKQGEAIEMMLPTEKMVLTSRESLEIALKRADFELARRFAGEVFEDAPDDPAANFAMGMANLEAKEYHQASVCFEKALKKDPDEPAALNNLAVAYMKMGEGSKALKCAEHAAKVYPNSPQIQQTLKDIRKNMSVE